MAGLTGGPQVSGKQRRSAFLSLPSKLKVNDKNLTFLVRRQNDFASFVGEGGGSTTLLAPHCCELCKLAWRLDAPLRASVLLRQSAESARTGDVGE